MGYLSHVRLCPSSLFSFVKVALAGLLIICHAYPHNNNANMMHGCHGYHVRLCVANLWQTMIHGLPVVLWCFPFCFTFITITIRIHKISRMIIKMTLVPPTAPATRASDSPPPLPTNILISISISFDPYSYDIINRVLIIVAISCNHLLFVLPVSPVN